MKTRPIKELLILLRDYFPKSHADGRDALCFAIHDLWKDHKIISYNEAKKLDRHIHAHRPNPNSKAAYFFPLGELTPRMKFLNKLISEL